ncbi:MAG: hypothetical protein GXO78_02255 [Calditrichaeota bacterium]|nr:hypothetical protein [Calditrichota bacterium]
MTARRKRRKQRKRSPVIYQLKKKSRQVAYGISLGFAMFLILIFLSLGFILYQTKNHLIRKYAQENQLLKEEILRLNSENNRYQTRIQYELASYIRIARIAREKLGLSAPVKPPAKFYVDGKEFEKYARKDARTSLSDVPQRP